MVFLVLRQDDHDFGGLDQRSSDLALLEPQFTDCVGGNDRSNVLFADREGDLGEQSTDLDVGDSPDELIASTDAAKSAPSFFDRARGDDAGQKAIYFCLGNAMMTANGLNALELAPIDPLLQRAVTDS